MKIFDRRRAHSSPSKATRAIAALAALTLAGCFGDGGDGVSSPNDVKYAYVVLGPNAQPVARAITTASACPAIVINGGSPIRMSLRAAAATIPPRPTAYDENNTVPASFPVTVCETTLPAAVTSATIGAQALPVPRSDPRKILVLGDTGCRLKQGAKPKDDLYQDCNDPAKWPYAAIARQAAKAAPDLIIHVGDLHYRETPCPADKPGCANSPYGFSWSSWEPDFFVPSLPLFAAAPWVFVRGDHEICSRAGQGWWRFVDPRPFSDTQNCNLAKDDDTVGDYSDPYAVPFAGDLQFLVFDSSVVAHPSKDARELTPSENQQVRKYAGQLNIAFGLGAGKANTFFLNHQPILAYNSDDTKKPLPGNTVLQQALQSLPKPQLPATLFPSQVQAVFSGHVHLWQIVTYSSGLPPAFVSGNGGTDRVENLTDLSGVGAPLPGATVAQFLSGGNFGYMMLERDAAGWKMTEYDLGGTVIAACTLAAGNAACNSITKQ